MRQVITSSFTLGFSQEGWSCLLWLRDVLPQQRRRRSICRVIKPLQYWIISTLEQLAGTWIFHGEFGLHKSCNKQIHCHICGDWIYIVVWLQKKVKKLDWRWLSETMQKCNPAGSRMRMQRRIKGSRSRTEERKRLDWLNCKIDGWPRDWADRGIKSQKTDNVMQSRQNTESGSKAERDDLFSPPL